MLAPDAAAHTKSKAKGYQITFMKEEGQCNELGVLCIIMYIIAINLPMFASEHALQIKEKICFFFLSKYGSVESGACSN